MWSIWTGQRIEQLSWTSIRGRGQNRRQVPSPDASMALIASVPDSIDGKGTSMLFIDLVFGQLFASVYILWSWSSLHLTVSDFHYKVLARDLACPQRIIRRPMVKLSNFIASSAMFFAFFVISRQRLGARCSLSLSLGWTTHSMPLPALIRYMWIASHICAFLSRYHSVFLFLVGEGLMKSLLISALPLYSNRWAKF